MGWHVSSVFFCAPPPSISTRSEARPIIDAQGRIIVVLAGRPRDSTYVEAVAAAYAAMMHARSEAKFPASMSKHRRGPFPPLTAGVNYSKGAREPSRMVSAEYGALLQVLLGNPNVQRMAIFASGKCPSSSQPRIRFHCSYSRFWTLGAEGVQILQGPR
jgi:hypothetical protein